MPMLRYRVRAIVLTGVVCVFALWGPPVRSQEAADVKDAVKEAVKEAGIAKAQPPTNVNPKAAITTKDPTIPVEELKYLVRPLTQEELGNEAAAWLVLLKAKVKEVSNAEIAVKRQNRTIASQNGATDALKKAQESLAEAEKLQVGAPAGSPEYEAATKKVEEAKENFKKAESAVKDAAITKKELKKDNTLKSALKTAQKSGDLEDAKQALDKAKQDRASLVAGSQGYEATTKKIDALEQAIKAFEDEQEAQGKVAPNSPEYKKATPKVEKARKNLQKAREAVEGVSPTGADKSKQSSEDLNNATTALKNSKIQGNLDTKVAGPVGVVEDRKSLNQKGQQIEKATKKLEKSTETESNLKNDLVVSVTTLQAEQTEIVDRLNVILDELKLKGGEVESYQKYIQAIGVVQIDVKDSEGGMVRATSWFKSEEGGLRWAGNIGKFVAIVVASIIISQILGIILNSLLFKFGGMSRLLRHFIVMLVKRGGILVGVMVALTALEVSLGPVLALLGGVSFVLAFALQSNLGNFASGLTIMVYKPFDVGDEIKIGDIWGWVDSISLASTTIKGFSGQFFIIPNNIVWSGTIENLTHDKIRQVKVGVQIGYDEDLAKVKQLLVETVKSHPDILSDPPVKAFVWEFGEGYINMFVEGWTKTPGFWVVYEQVLQQIQERFNFEEIAIFDTTQDIRIQKALNGKTSQPSPQDLAKLLKAEMPKEVSQKL